MKGIRKKIIAAVCALSVGAAVCLAGCGADKTQTQSLRAAVSYVAAESEVYSSTAEAVKQVADSVVEISTGSVKTSFGMQYIVSGAGSGVIVGKSGNDYLIVTNNHVIDGADQITVRTRSGSEFPATVTATDDSADIAVITIATESELKLAVWGDSDDLQIGETVIAIGNPLGNLGGTVTQGILSATGRTIVLENFSMTLLQTDAAINPGNSGGGLFNLRGQLIGVVNAKTSEEGIEGLCFAIPSNTARKVFGDLAEHGYLVGRATLGLQLAEGVFSGSQSTVVYVSSLGEKADGNFRQYDRLYSVNGKAVTSLLDYNNAMAEIKPGDVVQIEVLRGTVTQNMFGASISFGSSPQAFTVTALQYGA